MAIRHRLSARHRVAVLALLADAALTDAQLRACIGTHATNVVTSLVARRLILEDRGRWKLSARGRRLAAELMKPEAPPIDAPGAELEAPPGLEPHPAPAPT